MKFRDSDFIWGMRQTVRFWKPLDIGCLLVPIVTVGALLASVIVVPVQLLVSRKRRDR